MGPGADRDDSGHCDRRYNWWEPSAAVSVLQYRDEGFLPEALCNCRVRLGIEAGDEAKLTRIVEAPRDCPSIAGFRSKLFGSVTKRSPSTSRQPQIRSFSYNAAYKQHTACYSQIMQLISIIQ